MSQSSRKPRAESVELAALTGLSRQTCWRAITRKQCGKASAKLIQKASKGKYSVAWLLRLDDGPDSLGEAS